MDDALKRTRRNMIGVSVAIFLVYFFDAHFPDDLKVFNYDVPLDALTIEILAWCFLVYLIVEYFIHLKSKFSDITQAWQSQLRQLMALHVWNNVNAKQREDSVVKHTNQNKDLEFDHANLTISHLAKDLIIFNVQAYLLDSSRDIPSGAQGHNIQVKYQYSEIRWFRFRAWLKVIFTEGIGFEFLIPILYSSAAFGVMIIRKTPYVIELLSSKFG